MVTLALYCRAHSAIDHHKWQCHCQRGQDHQSPAGVSVCVVCWEQGRGRCPLVNSPLPTTSPSPASDLSLLHCGLSSEEQHHEKPDLYQRLSSFQSSPSAFPLSKSHTAEPTRSRALLTPEVPCRQSPVSHSLRSAVSPHSSRHPL